MDTLFYAVIAIVAHACKPPFKRRAQQIDGTFAGVMAALIFGMLSVASLVTALLAMVAIIF